MTPSQQIDAMADCLLRGLEKELEAMDEEIAFQATVRKQMGEQLKQYTCHDIPLAPNVTTTPAVQNTTWSNYNVRVLFDSDYSSVRIVEQFLTDSECQQILSLAQQQQSDVTTTTGNVTLDELLRSGPDVVRKLQTMMTSAMSLPSDYYSTTTTTSARQPDLRLIVDDTGTLTSTMPAADNTECVVQPDGSCASAADSPASLFPSDSLSSSRIVVTDDATVLGRLYVQCQSDSAKGGLMFFPKTGVRIQPVHGNAILIVYQDLQEGVGALRQEDPFLDEHMTCPVTAGRAVTLEEVYYRPN